MRVLLGKLFIPGKRYTGGRIAFVKDEGNGESAQIIHDDIAVQVLAVVKYFIKPRRPNLKVVMEKGIRLSFTVELDNKTEGLIAKEIEFEMGFKETSWKSSTWKWTESEIEIASSLN